MVFSKLPTHLIENIIKKCTLETTLKLKQTCSDVNLFVERRKLDKFDFGTVCFERKNEGIVGNALVVKMSGNMNHSTSCQIPDGFCKKTNKSFINKKMEDILSFVESIKTINFLNIEVNNEFGLILRKLPIDWKKTVANFNNCSYNGLSKPELIPFLKMFKFTSIFEPPTYYPNNIADRIDDEMMIELLPSVNFSCEGFTSGKRNLLEAPNITDRTLEFLAEKRPSIVVISLSIRNFTVSGLKELIQKLATYRDSNIVRWFIGRIRFNMADYRRIIDEIRDLETEYAQVRFDYNHSITLDTIEIEYQKENSDKKASIMIVLVKPTIDGII